MQPTKKQLEFWGSLIIICTFTAVLILIIDYSIKGSILQKSNEIRLAIEEWEVRRNGQRRAAGAVDTASDIGSDNPAYPSDLVDIRATGMEAPGTNGADSGAADGQGARRSKRKGLANPGAIPAGNEQVGS